MHKQEDPIFTEPQSKAKAYHLSVKTPQNAWPELGRDGMAVTCLGKQPYVSVWTASRLRRNHLPKWRNL